MDKEACRILIADDEPIERMVLERTIQNYFKEEVRIWQAVNGREAIEIFRAQKCQAVLLDISMPGIGGLEAAEVIRRESRTCSIIFLTAYDEFDFAKRAIRVHALDYLLKPGSKDELIAVLEEAVHLAKQTDKGSVEPLCTANESRDSAAETGTEEQQKSRILTEQIWEYISLHYMEDISLQDLSRQLHYSDAYFCRFFRQNFDKNFIMYLSEVRVAKAKELLADVTVNIKEVSAKAGYRDSSYFAKVFKRLTGETPSEYRYRHR